MCSHWILFYHQQGGGLRLADKFIVKQKGKGGMRYTSIDRNVEKIDEEVWCASEGLVQDSSEENTKLEGSVPGEKGREKGWWPALDSMEVVRDYTHLNIQKKISKF